MSEDMNNSVYRQKKIVEILKMLHEGGSFDEAKKIFDDTFSSVDVSEITAAERELISSGLNPMEIQNLCNVHAAVFKGAINPADPNSAEETPGHPVATMKLENMVLHSLLSDELLPVLKRWQQSSNGDDAAATPEQEAQSARYLERIQNALKDLATIEKHYQRKENLLFPLMDKYGITAPPKVMWGVDDEIRGWIKDASRMVNADPLPDKYQIEAAIEKVNKEIEEMIFKEEKIMLPMVDEVFLPEDWELIASESDDIGYTLIAQPLPWHPSEADIEAAKNRKPSKMAAELNNMAQSLADQQGLENKKPSPDAKPTISEAMNDTVDAMTETVAKNHQPDNPIIPPHLQGKLTEKPAADADKEAAATEMRANIDVNIDLPQAKGSQAAAKPTKPAQPADQPAPADDAAPAGMPESVRKMLAQNAAPAAGAPRRQNKVKTHLEIAADNTAKVCLPTGDLTISEIEGLLRVLPLDLTFVDANDIVQWFSDNGDRVFPRTRAVIGRAVVNCHPPKSMPKVQKILDQFRAGTLDHADFWINLHGEMFVYIRYFAIRDPEGNYLGCLEVTQDISEIHELEGEKRL